MSLREKKRRCEAYVICFPLHFSLFLSFYFSCLCSFGRCALSSTVRRGLRCSRYSRLIPHVQLAFEGEGQGKGVDSSLQGSMNREHGARWSRAGFSSCFWRHPEFMPVVVVVVRILILATVRSASAMHFDRCFRDLCQSPGKDWPFPAFAEYICSWTMP